MYKIANKFPLDIQPRKKIGFGFPLNGKSVFVPTYTTKDQIKFNLINYFLTNKGERVFNPFFGADLRKELFQNITEINSELLKLKIQNDLNLYFPGVKIEKLEIISQEDNNMFNIKLFYSLIQFGIEDIITLEVV